MTAKKSEAVGSRVFTREIERENREEHTRKPESAEPETMTALVAVPDVIDFDYKRLGNTLIEKAAEEQRERAQKLAISAVESILRDIVVQKRIILEAQAQIEKQQRRVAALQDGKFTIDPLDITIKFQDGNLNDGGGL